MTYFKLSPFMHADRINEPILLIHGSVDSRVLPKQAKLYRNALDKAGKKKAAQLFCLQGRVQAEGVNVVIFNGIAGAGNVGILKPLHRTHQLILHIKRQAGGDAVGIDFVGIEAFRLDKNLV